jgi:endonuclease YncB( thermonuclease family)
MPNSASDAQLTSRNGISFNRDTQRRPPSGVVLERFSGRHLGILSFVLAVVIAYLYGSLARSAPIDASEVSVIDGDTIRIHQSRPDVRLVGFNAPETRRAQCAAEEALGGKATRRLRDLVRSGKLDLTLVPCACRPSTEGTEACNFGRRCGVLKVDGRDVGSILIAEGLAVPFQCGRTSCPRTPRPWCQ